MTVLIVDTCSHRRVREERKTTAIVLVALLNSSGCCEIHIQRVDITFFLLLLFCIDLTQSLTQPFFTKHQQYIYTKSRNSPDLTNQTPKENLKPKYPPNCVSINLAYQQFNNHSLVINYYKIKVIMNIKRNYSHQCDCILI